MSNANQPLTRSRHDQLLEMSARLFPGACLGMMWLPPDLRMVMVRGEGPRIYDLDDTEYLDFMMGSGPLLLGHCHPEVVQAVETANRAGSTFFAMNEPAILLADKIVKASPCGEAIRFQTTGSEATFSALRLARAFTARDKILRFEGGWHGGHDLGQLSATPRVPPPFPLVEPDCDGIPAGALQDILVAPFNDLAQTANIISEHATDIAAIIVEPLQRVIRPEPDFLPGLRDLANQFGIVLVFDEIVTGFRIAWGGAQEKYGVVPDMACYGKAISAGYPLSAVVGRSDILELADPSRKGTNSYCFLSGALTANPVSCAAGVAAMDVLERPGTYEHLDHLGQLVREGLEELGKIHSQPVQVLGEGPVLQVFFSDKRIRNWRDTLSADRRKAQALSHELIRRKVFIGSKIYISTAHTEQEISLLLARADEALSAISV